MIKGRRKLIISMMLLLCVSSVILVSYLKRKPKEEKYDIDKIIQSIDKDIDVEIAESGKSITSNFLLDEYAAAMLFRMKDGNEIFPKYLKPDKVIVDVYDNLIMCYEDKIQQESELSKLYEDNTTLFAEEISLNDIVLDTIEIEDYSEEVSYAPMLMNSRIKASELSSKGIEEKIVIGIADTGLYSENSKIAKYIDVSKSYDYVNNDNNVFDGGSDQHATLVISALVDILGEDLASNNIRIINAKCLEDGVGSSYSLYTAICGLADDGCQIINMSLGAEESSEIVKFAIEYAEEKGCILVSAAGNEAGNVKYPAAYEETIAVSSINQNKEFSVFSNYGNEIDVCGPGEDLKLHSIEQKMVIASGTSLSSPIITAVIAMGKLEDSSIDNKYDAMAYIKKISQDLGVEGKDEYYGVGLPVFEIQSDMPEEPTEVETTTPKESGTEETTTVRPVEPEEPTTKKPISESPTEKETTEAKSEPEETTTLKWVEPEEPTTERSPKEPTTEKPIEVPTKQPTETPTEVPTEKPQDSKPSKVLYKVTGIWNPGITHLPTKYATYEWDGLDNAVRYEVYRADYKEGMYDRLDELNWKCIGSTTSTVYKDYTIEYNHGYFIKVRGIDANGNYGPFSNVIEIENYQSHLDNIKYSVKNGLFRVTFDEHPNESNGYELQIHDLTNDEYRFVYFDGTEGQVKLSKGKYRISVLVRSQCLNEDGVQNRHGGTDYYDIVID